MRSQKEEAEPCFEYADVMAPVTHTRSDVPEVIAIIVKSGQEVT